MIVTGLKQQSQGVNKIIANGCGSQQVDLTIKLSPGEANRTISRVLFTDGTGCSSVVYQVDYQTYADPLTTSFVLTQFNSLNVALSIDQCGAPTITGTWQLTVITTGPAITNDYYFDIEFVDEATIINTIIPTSDSYLIECLNQPGTTQTKFFTFDNPTDIPLRIDFSPSLSGLYWDANGVQTAGTFYIPANGSTVLSWANNWNVSPSNFTVDVYVCCSGTPITLNVTWASVVCGDCGLNCSGLSIATNTGWVETIPNPELPNSGTNWGVIAANGGGSVTAVFGNGVTDSQVFVTSSAGTPNFDSLSIDISIPNAFSWWFPASTPTPVDFEISIKFGTISIPLVGPTLPYPPEVPYLLQFTTNSITTPTTTQYYNSPFLQNTTYTFTASVSDFQYVTPISAGSINIYIPEPPNGTLITIESVSVKVLAQSIGTVDLDCSTLDLYNFSAIGDYKEVTYDLYYMNGWLNNAQLYFNPWLFSDTGDWSVFSGANGFDQPTSGYSLVVNQNWLGDGLWHDMALFGVNNAVGSQKNWTCKVQFVDSNAFKVKFAFFVTMDVLEYVRNIVLPNQRRLLSGSKNDFTDTASQPSVYNTNKLLSVYFYIIDPNVRVNNAPYECYFTRDVYFTARFLNMGLYGGPSEMTAPLFYLYRNSNPVNELSPFEATEVQFQVDYTNPIDTVTAWLIASTPTNNFPDFYYNYDASRATIVSQISGVLNKDIEAPSQGPTNIGGNTYQIKFNVGTGINPAYNYRILCVCYSSTDSMVNTFISSPLLVAQSPDVDKVCCNLLVNSSWNTLTQTYSGHCFRGSVKERIKHNLTLQSGSFETCLQDLGKAPGDSWLNYLDQVTLRVYKRLDNTLGQSEHLFFYYDQQTYTKNHVTQLWTGAAGQTLTVSDNGTVLLTSISPITIQGSNTPFAANAQNVAMASSNEPFNRSSVSANTAQSYVTSNNVLTSWGNEPVYLEYEFKFRLRFLPITATVNLYQINMVYANDYEPNPLPDGTNILDALEIYGVDSSANETLLIGQFCKQDYVYLKAKVITTNPVTYATGKLIAFIENVGVPNQFANQGEEESFTANYIGALSNNTLYDVDANFVAGEAYFKIDISNLSNGTYKLCALRTIN